MTPTSYLVLGFVSRSGPVTSYDMKQLVKAGIGKFWSFPHSQLYAEPERLVDGGFLSSRKEEGGRRRRLYEITPAGRTELEAWLSEPSPEGTELRDLALLKLYFCSLAPSEAVVRVAKSAAQLHADLATEWAAVAEALRASADPCQAATLELGIRYERAAAAFWREIAEDPPTST